ncbi:diguanylate cyclase [Massilia cavernae]|uniref:diguanylate cyclase n=1 Tax=Massilia cavernae TaxID=2320864 RepID=A0A418X6V5_9BURK|nr:diguanylate cyclase [Massilia cavernae]RJG08236.1 GGDEF domain-containing protein [Massilia cavernae]
MPLKSALRWLFLSADPKLARMLRYWGATVLVYAVCLGLLLAQVDNGTAERERSLLLVKMASLGLVGCFVLVRASLALGLGPSQLAMLQGVFGISLNVAGYAVFGPVRGASMLVLLVVIVFCTFALRPRHTLLLCAIALVSLGATMAAMALGDPLRYPPRVEVMHFALAAVGMISVTVLTGEMSKLRLRLKQQKEDLEQALARIRTLATIDELTLLANRRHMNELLVAEERREHADGHAACIALLDLDHFKSVNDRHGHAAGDAVLRAFADAAASALREGDTLARWGGEEFLLLLPETSLEHAQVVLRRIAARVGAAQLAGFDASLRITFSAGVTQRRTDEAFAGTISRADKALYSAKATGRDRIYPA